MQAYHKLAREDCGREVKVWTLANIVQGETEKSARLLPLLRAREGGLQAAQNMIDIVLARDQRAQHVPPERLKAFQEAFLAGWGGR